MYLCEIKVTLYNPKLKSVETNAKNLYLDHRLDDVLEQLVSFLLVGFVLPQEPMCIVQQPGCGLVHERHDNLLTGHLPQQFLLGPEG